MKEKFRLRKSEDFRKVFKEGKKFLSPHFILYIHNNILRQTADDKQACLRGARIGISISKNHFKLATRRNRLRRIAKELFRKELSARFKGYDFVVTSRRAHPRSNINKVVKELKYLITNPRYVDI
ncbi:MAG: ribonuclease P protein component [Candidatus Omnitrophota bacterium]|nr:MAG: ribonuclease P protein component [Candidatus Omnitrophota bacterium]